MKFRILFFDYWLKGLHNIIPIVEELPGDFDFSLLHVSSLQGIDEQTCKVVDGVKCYDVAHFPGAGLSIALKELSPDVLVMFNTTYILDRAICLEAKKLGIRTVFIQHGTRKYITRDNIESFPTRKSVNARKILRSIRYIGCYIRSKDVNLREGFVTFRVILEFLTKPNKSKFFPYRADECMADFCCLYSEAECSYYLNLGYPRSRIIVTGNPKLRFSKPYKNDKPYVLFIDEGLPEAGDVYNVCRKAREAVLEKTSASLHSIGFELIVKPHPLASSNNFDCKSYRLSFEKIGSLISGSEACICNVSTAGDNVVLEDKVLISLSDPEYRGVPKPYLEKGVAISLNSSDISDFKTIAVPSNYLAYKMSDAMPFDRLEFIGALGAQCGNKFFAVN